MAHRKAFDRRGLVGMTGHIGLEVVVAVAVARSLDADAAVRGRSHRKIHVASCPWRAGFETKLELAPIRGQSLLLDDRAPPAQGIDLCEKVRAVELTGDCGRSFSVFLETT